MLSHGHWDHYGGLSGFLEAKRRELATETHLYAGEDAFLHRWSQARQGPRRDMGRLDEAFIAGQDVDIVRVKAPQVLGGQALVSGEIPRRTPYEVSSPAMRVEQGGDDQQDDLPGEQALVYQLRGKGLVVLTACGHAGVVNTVLHAQEVTGVSEVYAVIGGFHLSGASNERIGQTVEGLAALDPEVIVPMHCTGPGHHRSATAAASRTHDLQLGRDTVHLVRRLSAGEHDWGMYPEHSPIYSYDQVVWYFSPKAVSQRR